MDPRVSLLLAETDATFERLLRRLQGLSVEEFFWEPAARCWTVYEDRPGHWTYHYAIPDPDPAPLTTIAWQLVHLMTTKAMYHEWAFGPARLTFPEIEIPHTPRDVMERLGAGHTTLRGVLVGLVDADLDRQVKTNWGELWPAWRVFWTMADHDAFHGGAIGNLRDLYHWFRDNSRA